MAAKPDPEGCGGCGEVDARSGRRLVGFKARDVALERRDQREAQANNRVLTVHKRLKFLEAWAATSPETQSEGEISGERGDG